MAKISLLPISPISPEHMASHAGRECYEADAPSLDDGKQIDAQSRLWKSGHHTTWQHLLYPFQMEDISVSTITFGFHLNHMFYNSDQRSGRFSKMYDNPDITELEPRLKKYFPNKKTSDAIKFIESGINIFQKNKDNLTEVAANQLRAERPNVTDKYIENNAKKMAQEQLRVFMSMIMPTGMVHSLSLTALAALWRTAWTPEMRDAVTQMKDAVLDKNPEIAYVFDESVRGNSNWAPVNNLKIHDDGEVLYKPRLDLLELSLSDKKSYTVGAKDSVDILQFSPFAMNNNTQSILTEIEISAMTMGQDQRHRTIARGEPAFTNAFYLPPLLKVAGLEKSAEIFMQQWISLPYSMELKTFIAPYGAMLRYQKRENVNALLHEQSKRLCWCAQEEIYNLNTQLMQQLKVKDYNNLVSEMLPPCANEKCLEGSRYCGRDISVWKNGGNGFKQRGI